MSGKYVDWDELIGFIMRKANENNVALGYGEIKAVLDAEKKYMETKNITYKIDD